MNLTLGRRGYMIEAEAQEVLEMRNYGQFCPVARASEVLGERWTIIIVRNLLVDATPSTTSPRALLACREPC